MRIALVAIVLAAVIAVVVLLRTCGSRDQGSEVAKTDQLTGQSAAPTESATVATGAPGAGGRLVDVDGHRLYIRTFGTGSPAVVIEPGLGDSGRVWGDVVDVLAEETRVVLYARAGYEPSDPGPMPRSPDRVIRELTNLLVATPVEAPYVVVGHSIGGLYALLFAAENPGLVKGLVLLDPPPQGFLKGERFPDLYEMAEDMTAGFRRDAERARAEGNETRAAYLEAVASEHEMMFETGWALLGSIQSLGDLPLVVIGSGVPNPQFGVSAEAFQQYWRESNEALSHLSTRGRFVFLKNSTHNIPGDAPDAVVEAVRYCLNAPEMTYEPAYREGDK
jgi:pimeloyl-ACP methyl ester carboxylesterase